MSKIFRIFLISGLFMAINNSANARSINDSDLGVDAPPINISLSNKLPSAAYQTAALSFLPELEDSELGFGNRDLNTDHNTISNCKDYNKKSCSNNQTLSNVCPFDPSRFKSCSCNLTKYVYSSENCTYYGGSSSDYLVDGTICKDEGKGNKKFGTSCSCTSSRFPYTDNSGCPNDKIVDSASYCKTTNPSATRYEKCKCDISKYNLTTQKDTTQGWECNKCSDSYGDHFECSARPCVDGSTNITSQSDCSGSNLYKDAGYMSGGNKCGKCEVKSNCHFFKNFDGSLSMPDSACSWDLYGHTASVYIPNGKSYSSGWIRMWGNSSISGEFTVGTLTSGMVVSNGGAYNQPRTITYNDRVTINELIKTDPDVTTSVFKKGVCGNFRCEFWRAMNGSNQASKVRDLSPGEAGCPIKASDCSDSCKSYFINADGNINIPAGQCGVDVYGHTASVNPKDSSTYQPRGTEYENFWVRMWGSTTINGTLKTKNLISGVVVSNGGYYSDPRAITFKGPVTISGILKTDVGVTTTRFDGGVSGDFTCENWTGTGGNSMKKLNDIAPGQPGCPCSQSRFKYDSSNCAGGTLSGTSCGGKFETCKVDDTLDGNCKMLSGKANAVFCGGMDPYGTQTPYCYSSSGSSKAAFMHNNGRTCWSCDEGSEVRCITNSPTIANCGTYKNGVCATCQSGYTLNGGACTAKTVPNCSRYDSNRKCVACNSGYRLNSGLCIACENCSGIRLSDVGKVGTACPSGQTVNRVVTDTCDGAAYCVYCR